MHRSLSFFALLVLLAFTQPACAASATLSGVVVDETNGAALAGARIKLTKTQDDEPLYARADWRGEFRFTDLAMGAYQLRAEQPGYMMPGDASHTFRTLSVDLTPPNAFDTTTAPYRLKVSKKVDKAGVLHGEVTVNLAPQGVVSGKVVDPNGIPLFRARVDLLKVTPLSPGTTIRPGLQPLGDGKNVVMTLGVLSTDDRGEFRIAPLEAGTYYLRCTGVMDSGPWASDYRTTYYPGALDLASAKPIPLRVGEKVRAGIQIMRQAGVRVAGQITFSDSAAAANDRGRYTRVHLFTRDEKRRDSSPVLATVKDGRYEFNDVLPGTYMLVATTYERQVAASQPLLGAHRVVEVGTSGAAGVDIAVQPLPDIQGVISFEPGCDPTPVQVYARSRLGVSQRAPVRVESSDGAFTVKRVEPGPIRMFANSFLPTSPYLWITKMTLDGRDILNQEFDVPLSGGATVNITMGCSTRRIMRAK